MTIGFSATEVKSSELGPVDFLSESQSAVLAYRGPVDVTDTIIEAVKDDEKISGELTLTDLPTVSGNQTRFYFVTIRLGFVFETFDDDLYQRLVTYPNYSFQMSMTFPEASHA